MNQKTTRLTEEQLIEACRRQDRQGQQVLYDRYANRMFSLCRRYIRNREDAEDVMVNGFFKVLTNIHQYSGTGSFEGWMRRIMVNQALMFLRKKHNFKMTVEVDNLEIKSNVSVEDELAAQDIM
ncbi:MAG: RNA polymerase sigma factor, partial [Bacteroidota bacterium]